MSDRFTVEAFVDVEVPRVDGRSYRLAAGLNEGVPADVAQSWYAKAAGCRVVAPRPAKKPEAKKV